MSIFWLAGVAIMFCCGALCCACIIGLLFCDIRFSRFSGEAAEKIRECQKELDKMFTM